MAATLFAQCAAMPHSTTTTLRRHTRTLLYAVVFAWAVGVLAGSVREFTHARNTARRTQEEATWFEASICANGGFRKAGGLLLNEFCTLAWDHVDALPTLAATSAVSQYITTLVQSVFAYWPLLVIITVARAVITSRIHVPPWKRQ